MLVLDAWGNSGVPFVNGDGTVTINEVLSSKETDNYPTIFSLDQVYPNPFNPVTSIVFSVPEHSNENVVIQVFDISGRLVTTLIDRTYNPGRYKLHWDASDVSSGIYFAEFRAGSTRQIQKITLLK